jgi:acetylornithine/succinyldiaminopimelate/putrescine aminotransferase
MIFSPALTIGDAEIAEFVEKFTRAVEATHREVSATVGA